jgi:hypothetical protein
MWKRPTAIFFLSITPVSVTLALIGVHGATTFADARAAMSGPVIACFHKEIGRFTAQAHPSRCNLRGYRAREAVEIPIRGMNWGHWGSNPTRAAYGVDKRNRTAVRIIAFRPVACGEGRTWYSRVVVLTFPDGNSFELRLPICGSTRHGLRPMSLTRVPAPLAQPSLIPSALIPSAGLAG